MNKQQITNLLGAGTMTALIVGIGMLLSNGGQPTASADQPENLVASTELVMDDTAAMRQTIRELQAREAEYAAQIELANQLLAEQNNNATYDDDEYEDDEYEDDEYEDDEYEDDEYEDDEYEDDEYEDDEYEDDEDDDEYEDED